MEAQWRMRRRRSTPKRWFDISADPFDLQRFVTAQETTFDRALRELQAGQKRSHWMWFIFPQLRGLGHSVTAEFYGVSGLDEARAYLSHPVLAPRLDLTTRAVLATKNRSLQQIFGSPDDMKFRSSMTLFVSASKPGSTVFQDALNRWFDGAPDEASARIIGMPSLSR